MPSRTLESAGWATGAVVLGVAAGGAASSPDGFLLALPTLPLAVAAGLVLAALALVAGRRAGPWLLAAAPVLLLVLAGARLPGVAADQHITIAEGKGVVRAVPLGSKK